MNLHTSWSLPPYWVEIDIETIFSPYSTKSRFSELRLHNSIFLIHTRWWHYGDADLRVGNLEISYLFIIQDILNIFQHIQQRLKLYLLQYYWLIQFYTFWFIWADNIEAHHICKNVIMIISWFNISISNIQT